MQEIKDGSRCLSRVSSLPAKVLRFSRKQRSCSTFPESDIFPAQKEKFGSKCRRNIFDRNFENDTNVSAFCRMCCRITKAKKGELICCNLGKSQICCNPGKPQPCKWQSVLCPPRPTPGLGWCQKGYILAATSTTWSWYECGQMQCRRIAWTELNVA